MPLSRGWSILASRAGDGKKVVYRDVWTRIGVERVWSGADARVRRCGKEERGSSFSLSLDESCLRRRSKRQDLRHPDEGESRAKRGSDDERLNRRAPARSPSLRS